MPTPSLHDFIATVPSCIQTTPLEAVLDLFERGQCDRLVVVNEQHYPLGVLYLARLMPQLLKTYRTGDGLDVQQTLAVDLNLVEPSIALPAQLSLEQFGLCVRERASQMDAHCTWALVDPNNKFLGLLDSQRLLKFLAYPLAGIPTTTVSSDAAVSDELSHRGIDLLIQLLEHLPWPLLLQTDTGEVVTQNPAWWQHFGPLSNPEAVRREVEVILKTANLSQAEGSSLHQEAVRRQETPHETLAVEQIALSSEGATITLPPHINAHTANFAPEDDRSAASSRCQLGTQPGTCICVWPMPNGQERVWQFVSIPLDLAVVSRQAKNGQISLLLAQDVTEQQQLASELAAKNADLIQLNRLKDEFLACISHELKTPLTAVLGLSSLLKDQLLGELNERQARYVRLIHESGRHLMNVVNDILDLTRMETRQMELTLESVQIASVCDRAIEQARSIQPETSQSAPTEASLTEQLANRRFQLSIEPDLDSLIADELRLRQMLVHLLSNAFKFTEAGGEIGLRVSRWEGWIAFTVWDTGIGIPEQKQHLIFQKFQQLENPLTRRFEGTGLGLVLTRALARLHGGDVSFFSKEGKGSQFTLLLPPSPPQSDEVGGTKDELLPLSSYILHPSSFKRNRLMLVVEAAPRFIENLTDQLTDLGYPVVIARSGTEALEKARRLQPGAIFLNPLLPLLSGWDVLTLLKSDVQTRQIPVIVTSTRVEKEQAFSKRADDFLSLPVQQQALQQLLTRCAMPPPSQPEQGTSQNRNEPRLTILHLISEAETLSFSSRQDEQASTTRTALNYRVLEADDLEQAEMLARVWQPDVVLLDPAIPNPVNYLQQLSEYSSLASLPLVTLDAATTQAANQVKALSVFPCLTSAPNLQPDALLSVLQIAVGMSCKPSLLVVDVATLLDLQEVSEGNNSALTLGSEWFQALIQYLQTAGFRAVMGRSWAEVQQQIRQQSVDLLLICLGDSSLHPGGLSALTALTRQRELPPVLVLDRRLGQAEFSQQCHHLEELGRGGVSEVQTLCASPQSDAVESLETILGAIATQILPPSLSMKELLTEINQTLAGRGGRGEGEQVGRWAGGQVGRGEGEQVGR